LKQLEVGAEYHLAESYRVAIFCTLVTATAIEFLWLSITLAFALPYYDMLESQKC
jgi:hypothetical protein